VAVGFAFLLALAASAVSDVSQARAPIAGHVAAETALR
jgi:hypothetical protein